ncbi:hypothetical protein K0M31_020123 [Melipona bicolor]|uniref:Uncharacterized protein n=1 Tax=Melipona bicolor TaxID=60889 RepID=A0AA40G1Y0_9HYME|nr:hypothetical protein K0M31_020123 [Melipona bicolor]
MPHGIAKPENPDDKNLYPELSVSVTPRLRENAVGRIANVPACGTILQSNRGYR